MVDGRIDAQARAARTQPTRSRYIGSDTTGRDPFGLKYSADLPEVPSEADGWPRRQDRTGQTRTSRVIAPNNTVTYVIEKPKSRIDAAGVGDRPSRTVPARNIAPSTIAVMP